MRLLPGLPRALALVVVLIAVLPAAASAAITSSTVTSPAPGPLPLSDERATPAQTITVSGTTTGGTAGETVDLRCTYAHVPGDYDFNVIGSATLAADGSFSKVVDLELFARDQACVLRAVPTGHPQNATLEPFDGPELSDAGYEEYATGGKVYDFYASMGGRRAYWGWDSATSCGPYGQLVDPLTLKNTRDYVHGCQASLFEDPESKDRESILVGGVPAYGTDSQHDTNASATGRTVQQVVSLFRDMTTGDLTTVTAEGLSHCASAAGVIFAGPDPDTAECPRFVPSGVMLERTTRTSHEGLMATVTDRFRSTDGAAHPLGLAYTHYLGSSAGHAEMRLPGAEAYTERPSTHTESVSGQAPFTIAFRDDAGNVDPLKRAWGAITITDVPHTLISGPRTDYSPITAIHTERTVPATGDLTIAHKLTMAYTEAAAAEMAFKAEDELVLPSIAIAGPADGATVDAASVTVTGTASDNKGIASVKVNGRDAALSGESWSVSVPLGEGDNKLEAVAFDAAGNSVKASRSVRYVKPVAQTAAVPPQQQQPAPAPAAAAASARVTRRRGARVRVAKGRTVVDTGYVVACPANGPACTNTSTLTFTTPGRANAAARVTLGRRSIRVAAGASKEISIVLSRKGARRVRRARRSIRSSLRMVTRVGTGAPTTTTRALRLKAPRRR